MIGSLICSSNKLFFVVDISGFFAIASAIYDFVVFIEFSRDGFDDWVSSDFCHDDLVFKFLQR